MECIEQPLTEYQNQLERACEALPCPIDRTCFFDIETTGLSAKISSLYLLGAAFIEEGTWKIRQWFADDYTSETDILTAFSMFLTRFNTVAHYNGSTFDIPYLEKKYQAHKLASPFAGKESLDLYRKFPHKKNAMITRSGKTFPLSDKKLTTMERLLGFHRHDNYSGKDCIGLYTDFMQKKYFRDDRAKTLKAELLLHNHDDLIGTILCSQLLGYEGHHPEQPHGRTEVDALLLTDKLTPPVPFSLSYEHKGVSVSFEKDLLTLRIPLFHGTLYHYFEDYKNYYYLPDEDMAVHKSVGVYVEPAYREKATATNCYIKKTGIFLPLPPDMKTDQPTFRETRRSSVTYLPWTDQSSLSEEECRNYMTHLMNKS